MLIACRPVRDARQTVAVADSLRVNHGVAYANGVPANNVQRGVGDSLALAEAYVTTGKWRYIYPNDYARACYYYGYMLRQHGDQVAAMRAFIAGTHAPYVQRLIPLPHFRDYHILGRIYTNMGMMCHDNGEFELAYDMYKLSAEQFQEAHDTTAYYYALNAMAYEIAEQNLHDQTFSLLSRIETECTDANVLTKTWETKAELYRNLAQYDSAIYAARQLYAHGYRATSGYVTMAQAFWNLQQYDSALYYAEYVINRIDATSQEKYNMLYILTYNNTSISSDEIKQRAEERADIDKEILDPLHIQLAQAIDVLLQDKNRKPYYISIGILIIVVCILAMTTRIAALRIKRHRKHLYAETERERQKQLRLQQQQRQLYAEHLAVFEQNSEAIRCSEHIQAALCWKDFDQMCRYINDAFFMFVTKLTAAGKFNEYEVRLCVLVLLDLDYETISHILKRAQNGIGKAKYRVAQKLGTTTGNLRQFLINLAIDAPTKDL